MGAGTLVFFFARILVVQDVVQASLAMAPQRGQRREHGQALLLGQQGEQRVETRRCRGASIAVRTQAARARKVSERRGAQA